MGIRINMIMGYGLDDVIVNENNYYINDPRFNKKGYLGDQRDYTGKKYTRRGFLKRLKREIDKEGEEYSFDKIGLRLVHFSILKDHKDLEMHHCIFHNGEYGLPNVVCFVPPSETKYWMRHDDVLDYYLVSSGLITQCPERDITPWYKIYDRPFYPYDSWIDKTTGVRGNNWVYEIKQLVNHMPELRLVPLGEKLKELFPLDSTHGDVYDRFIPMIPEELTELLKYCKVFTDDKVMLQLRPMIYCYWS